MIFVATFCIFLVFVGGLALGLLIKRKPLLSENEANDILEGLTCASCTSACSLAGSRRAKPKDQCAKAKAIPCKVEA